MRFKVGDEILVMAGKDKGQKGTVEKIFPTRSRLLVAGVNVYKRHRKGMPGGKPGGIIEFSRPLPVSNIALICPTCHKPTRIGTQVLKDGSKIRMCRKCGKGIEERKKAK
ncbi:50S ribosomal protein L24 [Candidatus Microgenomates bacterium]|nr:50S ribosomal protein L24 [Candidatus Microgenomates bacterium]